MSSETHSGRFSFLSRSNQIITIVLVTLCVAMTAANAYLLNANKTLRAYANDNRKEVPAGQQVKSIAGLDLRDNPISVTPSDNKATVLMVYSPSCPFCKRNWPTWSSMIGHSNDQHVEFVLVDLTSTASSQFIAEKNVGRAKVIRKLDPQQVVALNLNMTPQTIVIGSDSRVKKVFTGVLSADDIAALNKLLS